MFYVIRGSALLSLFVLQVFFLFALMISNYLFRESSIFSLFSEIQTWQKLVTEPDRKLQLLDPKIFLRLLHLCYKL